MLFNAAQILTLHGGDDLKKINLPLPADDYTALRFAIGTLFQAPPTLINYAKVIYALCQYLRKSLQALEVPAEEEPLVSAKRLAQQLVGEVASRPSISRQQLAKLANTNSRLRRTIADFLIKGLRHEVFIRHIEDGLGGKSGPEIIQCNMFDGRLLRLLDSRISSRREVPTKFAGAGTKPVTYSFDEVQAMLASQRRWLQQKQEAGMKVSLSRDFSHSRCNPAFKGVNKEHSH
ncbi:MAG: hypothetical protein AB7G80_09135 [Dongiaceae bacterium]